jgi:hypothetical protein
MAGDSVRAAASQQAPPLVTMPVPEHVSIGSPFQESHYDATSGAPLGPYVENPSGPVDFATGELTGEPFPDSGLWKQTGFHG